MMKSRVILIGVVLALILSSGCLNQFRSRETTTIAGEETTIIPTTSTPPKFNVGYRVIDFQYADDNGTVQTLTTAIWYPTNERQRLYTYRQGSYVFASRIAPDSSIAEGNYPLIIFAHGGYGCALNSAAFTEYLASQGFIVAAADYEDKIAPEFNEQSAFCRIKGKEGGNIKGFVPSRGIVKKFMDTMNSDREEFISYLDENRLGQTSFIIDKMLELDKERDSPFYNTIDEDAIGISGHSLGGVTILGLIGAHPDKTKEERIKAVLIFSGGVYPFENNIQNIDIPIMVMAGDNDEPMNPEVPRKLTYEKANPPKYYLVLKDSTHFSFGDRKCMGEILSDCHDSNTQAGVIDEYGLAFFDMYLRNGTGKQLNGSASPWAYYTKEEKPGEVQEWGEDPGPGKGGPGGIGKEFRRIFA